MISPLRAIELFKQLQVVTNEMADELELMRKKMQGRGINPAEVPLVSARLLDIEGKLRQIGSNMDNPVPF